MGHRKERRRNRQQLGAYLGPNGPDPEYIRKSEARRKKRVRQQNRRERAFYAALKKARAEEQTEPVHHSHDGVAWGALLKSKVRLPREQKLRRHSVAVESVAVVTGFSSEVDENGKPHVTSVEISERLKRSGNRRHKSYRSVFPPSGNDLGVARCQQYELARDVVVTRKKREKDPDHVPMPRRAATVTPPGRAILDGAINCLSNDGWTLLRLQYDARDKRAIALTGKLNEQGKRVRKPILITNVKTRAAALECLRHVHQVLIPAGA